MYIDKPRNIMHNDYVILCLTRKSEKVIKIILEMNFLSHVCMYFIASGYDVVNRDHYIVEIEMLLSV